MPNRGDFHSDDVQAIMGKAPSWVIRWGITTVFSILGVIMLGCYFIKYPDIISSPAEITTHNPPVDLVTRYDGLIDTLCVRNGEIVEIGTLIAVLNNTSKWSEVQFISERLANTSYLPYQNLVSQLWISNKYDLGDLQSSFSNFQKSCRDYDHHIKTEHITKKKELLRKQIEKNREYYTKLQNQYEIIQKDIEYQNKSYKRDSSLHEKGVISSSEFDISSQNLLLKRNSEAGFNATLVSTELQMLQNEQQLVELTIQQDNEVSNYEKAIMQNTQQLSAEIAKWKQLYTIIAPTTGRITFINYWSKNQHIRIGDKLASIVPEEDTMVIGRVQIPSSGFGKIKIGQSVNIKLNGYPYMEFGVLKGLIRSLSAVPEQVQTQQGISIAYFAEVSFPEGLKTSYDKTLPMIQRMDGTAEIITEDMRLISRFIYPIVSLFKNR